MFDNSSMKAILYIKASNKNSYRRSYRRYQIISVAVIVVGFLISLNLSSHIIYLRTRTLPKLYGSRVFFAVFPMLQFPFGAREILVTIIDILIIVWIVYLRNGAKCFNHAKLLGLKSKNKTLLEMIARPNPDSEEMFIIVDTMGLSAHNKS
jgi:hypothetical protein